MTDIASFLQKIKSRKTNAREGPVSRALAAKAMSKLNRFVVIISQGEKLLRELAQTHQPCDGGMNIAFAVFRQYPEV